MLAKAAPIIVERMCPTCMGLAILGLENSTKTFCPLYMFLFWLLINSGNCFKNTVGLIQKLIKPGPAISIRLQTVFTNRDCLSSSVIVSAAWRTGTPHLLAILRATLVVKSPWDNS